jgi:hypothetical protein
LSKREILYRVLAPGGFPLTPGVEQGHTVGCALGSDDLINPQHTSSQPQGKPIASPARGCPIIPVTAARTLQLVECGDSPHHTRGRSRLTFRFGVVVSDCKKTCCCTIMSSGGHWSIDSRLKRGNSVAGAVATWLRALSQLMLQHITTSVDEHQCDSNLLPMHWINARKDDRNCEAR